MFSTLNADTVKSFERLKQQALQRHGEDTYQVVSNWIGFVEANKQRSVTEKVLNVNDFFNNMVNFSSDPQLWGQADYWATPLETLSLRQGDCEDFVIAKYVTLLELGVSESQLRLVYVQINVGDPSAPKFLAHMVLAFYPQPNADPLILDNIGKELRFASQRMDLTPVFSFNASQLWVAGQQQAQSNSQSRLSRWQDVLKRIKQDGFLYD